MAKIIGHRGASGLALENTKESFLKAIEHGVDIIELDTHLTADGKLVVLHDPTTGRIAMTSMTVRQKTLKELQKLRLHNDENLLNLDEALDVIGSNVPVFIELKSHGSTDELLLVLSRHPETKAAIVSFFADELRQIRRALPDIPIYVSEHFAPVAIIGTARQIHANGIQLNKWLMNPTTYKLAQRYGLELNVYTVNSPFLAKWMKRLYPDINIYTNHPERFVKKHTTPHKRSLGGTSS